MKGSRGMKSSKKEVSFRRKLMTAVLSVTLPLIALLLFSNLYSTQAFYKNPQIRRKSYDEQAILRTACWICNPNATKHGDEP